MDEIQHDPEGSFLRTLDCERGSIDLSTGEFDATLATDGEASDGHILSIKGGRVPSRMPLLLGHTSDGQVPSLGSVFAPIKEEHRIRVRPRVNLNGDDPLADVRRGIAQLMHDGDLNAMSVRWLGLKATRRVNLPANHAAFVPDTDDTEKRWGLFFEKWEAREGSVVAIGADPKALIGRSEQAGSEIERVFWVMLARSVEASPDSERMGPIAAALDGMRSAIGELQDVGADRIDFANAVDAFSGVAAMDVVPYTYIEDGESRTIHLPRSAWESLRGESLREFRSATALYRVAEESETQPRDGHSSSQPPATPADATRDEAVSSQPPAVIPAEPPERVVSFADAAALLLEAGRVDATDIANAAVEAVERARGRVRHGQHQGQDHRDGSDRRDPLRRVRREAS